MACDNLLSLTQGKCLGHIFLLHHLNLMLSHLTFLYFNSVYLRESCCIHSSIDWSSEKFHGVTSQLPILAVICIGFPLSSNWFHISNKICKKLQSAIDSEELSCVAAVLWLLNSPPLCLAAQVESRKISISDLDHEPKGNCSAVLAAEQAEHHIERKWPGNPQPSDFRSLMMGNPRASCRIQFLLQNEGIKENKRELRILILSVVAILPVWPIS